MTRTVRSAALLIALVTTLALGGCGSIKERKERADRVIDSVDKAIAAGSAQMIVSSSFEMKLDQAERLAAGGAAADEANGASSFPVHADLANGRAVYLVRGADGAAQPFRLYAGTTIYARRPPDQASTTQRPWVRLDLTGIDPDEIDNEVDIADAVQRLSQVQGVENPLFLLHLLRGTLSGSVEVVGEEQVGGVETTHYRLNIDREKAVDDDDEDVQDAYETLFKSMFATRTVFPGEVWLDDDGVPRKYSVTLKSKVRRRALADVRLTVEMFDVGNPVEIVLPGKDETSTVEGLGDLTQFVMGGA